MCAVTQEAALIFDRRVYSARFQARREFSMTILTKIDRLIRKQRWKPARVGSMTLHALPVLEWRMHAGARNVVGRRNIMTIRTQDIHPLLQQALVGCRVGIVTQTAVLILKWRMHYFGRAFVDRCVTVAAELIALSLQQHRQFRAVSRVAIIATAGLDWLVSDKFTQPLVNLAVAICT